MEDEGKEYEGTRRGMSGRGGAGARGYLVSRREEAVDVGDLMVAGVSVGVWSEDGCSLSFEIEEPVLRFLRCFCASPL